MIMEGKVCYIHSRELLLKSELNHRVNKRVSKICAKDSIHYTNVNSLILAWPNSPT